MDYKTIRETFDYREDGKLIWKYNRSSNARKGTIAGSLDHGNPLIVFDGKRMLESKVIYLWHNGNLPKKPLYHINGDKTDNRIENLREGSQTDNYKNFYEKIRNLFDYREDGNLVWKVKKSGITKKTAGCMHREGYKVVTLNKKQYQIHRLIWLWHHGFLPEVGIHIDHINGHRDDNRIENLRMATNKCNQRNTGNWETNTSGVKGVVKGSFKKWRASIRVDNKLYNLGDFNDLDEAVLHRLAAEQCLNWNKCDEDSPANQYAVNHNLIRKR